jgi:CRP-like cAMP-binding protein
MEGRKIKQYNQGDYIFRENEKGEEMYILQEGVVELRKKVGQGEKCLKVVDTPKDFFGEMALVDESPRSASAVAVTDTTLVAVNQPAFENMILTNGKFALKIIKILSARIRNSNVQISELIAEVPKERCIRGMVDYAVKHGEKIFNGGIKVDIEDMKGWINNHVGLAKRDIDNCLSKLLKTKQCDYAATSAKTKEEIVLPEQFIQRYNRRQM